MFNHNPDGKTTRYCQITEKRPLIQSRGVSKGFLEVVASEGRPCGLEVAKYREVVVSQGRCQKAQRAVREGGLFREL